MIRVVLPAHLRTLAQVDGEVRLDLGLEPGTPTPLAAVLDALERAYPPLVGTIRNRATGARRPFVRFFVGEEDYSHRAFDEPLPEPVVSGAEPFYVIGAMAGG